MSILFISGIFLSLTFEIICQNQLFSTEDLTKKQTKVKLAARNFTFCLCIVFGLCEVTQPKMAALRSF